MMVERDFIFKLEEVKTNNDPLRGKIYYPQTLTGMATVYDDGRIDVLVDDAEQPSETFISNDSFFRKIMRAIHEKTKGY